MENYSAIKVKTWAVSDQPKEKIFIKGINSLSDAELLSILVGFGNDEMNQVDIARSLLASVNNSLNDLSKLSVGDLCRFEGLTKSKAVQIVSALEIGRRRRLEEATQKGKIGSSKDVFNMFHPLLGDLPHEEFWILLLNRSNHVVDKVRISQGGVSGTVIDTRLILRAAIEKLASGLILCHNHPSGNTQPSEPDKKITEKIQSAANFMEINLLDHIIIADNSFFSFADEGMM